MKNKINNNVNTNKEDKNMENNAQAPVNAAPAAENDQVQNNVPTPPVEGQAPASEEKPKKKGGLLKKIFMIIGAILALIGIGFGAGRISAAKDSSSGSSDDEYDQSGNDIQTTDF